MKPGLFVKVDGSYRQANNSATGGRVIYFNNRLIEASPLYISANSSMEAEYQAVQHTLSHLLLHLPLIISKLDEPTSLSEIKIIRLYTDNKVLIRHLNGSSVHNTKSLREMCEKMLYLINEIEEKYTLKVERYWIPRKCNLVADTLCKYAQCFNSSLYNCLA